MIQKLINDICNILDISTPSISYDVSNFSTDTMMAQVNSEGTIIYLKKFDNPNPDQFFAIAHELRHIWQMKKDKQTFLSRYKTIEHCQSIEEYNLQIAEVDANAFAALIMISFFQLNPLFKGLPESVIAKIHERMEYLKTIL